MTARRAERRPPAGPALAGALRSRAGGEGGFTLVELLVVMLITGIIAVAALLMLSNLSGVFSSQQTRILNQDDARTAINQIARYLRMATSSADNMTTQSNSIATAEAQNIEFFCDINGDNIAEKVRYYLSGTTLFMQTSNPVTASTSPFYQYPSYQTNGVVVQKAVRNGTSAIFTYYYLNTTTGGLVQFTPTTTSDRQKIMAVTISLTVNEEPQVASGNVAVSTEVELRQRYQGGLSEQ